MPYSSSSMTLALIAAFPGELRPLVRGWTRSGPLFSGRIGPRDAVAIAAGMGAAAATRACEALLARHPDTLVSIGFAGSLSCGLRPPDAVPVREVIDARTGERFLTDSSPGDPAGQRLVTLDRVADPAEKRRLAETHQAALVDMEAAAVARFARHHHLRFLCFKAVTDGPNDRLPDFNRFTRPDGQLRTPALIAYAALHPLSWSPLRRLGRNSHLASRRLAILLSHSLPGSQ